MSTAEHRVWREQRGRPERPVERQPGPKVSDLSVTKAKSGVAPRRSTDRSPQWSRSVGRARVDAP